MVQAQSMNPNTGMQQPQGNNNAMQPNPMQQGGRGGSNAIVFAIAAILVVIVIVIVYLAFSSISSSSSSSNSISVSSQSSSMNSTPTEMSYSQAQALLESSLSQYSGYDLFKPTSPTNITGLERVVSQLQNNATSGWVTYAAGSNATANASLEYVVIATKDTAQIASALNNVTLYDLPMTLKTANSGSVNGLSYNYAQYVNTTANFQTVSGYKNGYVVDVAVNSYPIFTMNEIDLVNTVANDTP